MKNTIILIGSILLVFLTGLSKYDNSLAEPAIDTTHIFPLSIGNTWIYSSGDTIIIDKTTSLNGIISFHFTGERRYTYRKTNLFYEGSILYGWNDGDTVATKLFDETALIDLPFENISVPAGNFDTYKHNWSSDTTQVYWYAVGHGIVKYYQSELVEYSVQTTSLNNQPNNLVKSYALEQNFPNPFNPSTTIEYQIPEKSKVNIRVFNLLGEQVAQLVNETQTMGLHRIKWNASNYASGVYIYQLHVQGSEDKFIREKMLLVK